MEYQTGRYAPRALCCRASFTLVLILTAGAACTGACSVQSDTLYYLDQNKNSIVQRIEPRDKLEDGCKFVQVEVVKVVNPKRYALQFKVAYRATSGEETSLGSFSLFPADNPGKFIVPSQGKVKNEGAIVLSLVVQDKMDPKDSIQVAVKRIAFLKQ